VKFIFIADFFMSQILGGGEINNEEFIHLLELQGLSIIKINSELVTTNYIKNNKDHCFIISNFINLTENVKNELMNSRYVIYEHDHKYLKNRNPGIYKNFIAPKTEIVNFEFYKNAINIFAQSHFHKKIIYSNLNLNNLINLSGNLWSLKSIDLIREMSHKEKDDYCSIMKSAIPHKNQSEAVKYCELKNKEYRLIHSKTYSHFLSLLGTGCQFIFFPKTTETLSRVVVEARMMNVKITTNSNVGATKEPWFKLKGTDLIEEIEMMRCRIPKLILQSFK
jgi:hypothetical protein